MKKRLQVFLMLLIFSAFCTFAASFAADEEDQTPIYESVPKRMVVYQGDMAFARDDMTVYSGKNIQIILPPQAIPESVQITDGGKRVTQFNLISDGTGSRAYSSGAGIRNLLSWKSPAPGSRKIRLDYMMRGLSWTPGYIMEIKSDNSVYFNYRVGIRNQSDITSNVDLILVSGQIGSPTSGSGNYYRAMNKAQANMNAYEQQQSVVTTGSPYIGATRISAWHAYTMPKARLDKNGVAFVTLCDRELKAKKEYVWATSTGNSVDIIYTVFNETDQPFAEGLVGVYQKDIFAGSDMIEWTPAGGKGHVTIGGAIDIQASKTIDVEEIPARKHDKEYKHQIKLQLENFSNEARTVKIIENKYADAVETNFDIKPEKSEAGTYMWSITIPAKSKKSINYDFFSDSRYGHN
ncbi:MAG: hypothetical protein LWY06_16050 [Firmicutes bacterium]|nr:hypothetical protein [Bacillota bacterium]